MAVDIDLYHCELDDLKEHIQDIRHVGIDKLEYYVQQMAELIDDQKAKDKEAGNYTLHFLYNLHITYYMISCDDVTMF